MDSGRTVNYTFDSLNRLTAASTSGSTNYAAWGLSWTYDRYGNRTAQTATAGSPPANSTPVNTATNQVTGMAGYTFTYDANGNLTKDDNYLYTYDAENRLIQVQPAAGGTAITTYAFDGRGKRSVKVAVGQPGSNRTFTLYSGSQIISEFNDASTATYTAGTTPGQAPSDTVSLLLYQHTDHMSTRLTTDQQGNVATQRGNFPYGDYWYENGGAAMGSVPRKFSKYMLDSELSSSALHSSLAREHSARMGRFHTADFVAGRAAVPQRLNRYSYASNDPINRWDPHGLDDWVCVDDCDLFAWGGGGGGGAGSGDAGTGSAQVGPGLVGDPELGQNPGDPPIVDPPPDPLSTDPLPVDPGSGYYDPSTGVYVVTVYGYSDPGGDSSGGGDPVSCEAQFTQCMAKASSNHFNCLLLSAVGVGVLDLGVWGCIGAGPGAAACVLAVELVKEGTATVLFGLCEGGYSDAQSACGNQRSNCYATQ